MCFKWVSNEGSFYKEYSLISHKVLLLYKREGTIKDVALGMNDGSWLHFKMATTTGEQSPFFFKIP